MSGHFTRLDSRLHVQVLSVRIIALVSLLFWLGRWWMRLGLHQLQGAAFIEPRADNLYWIFLYFNIPQSMLAFSGLGLTVDLLLLCLPLLIIRYPRQRLWGLLYAAMTVLYLITYNSSATHHEHTLVGIVFSSFLLCFKDENQFRKVFQALRYYSCFLMASAAFWKIGRGALWHPEQMQNILLLQHADGLILYPDALFSRWIQFLIENPFLSGFLWWGASFLELIFITGFFTRKFDKYLFVAFWLFILSDYFVMGLHFWELSILSLFFWLRIRRYFD